eukprot:11221263-Lingulodinium_polyedra.AAC.1
MGAKGETKEGVHGKKKGDPEKGNAYTQTPETTRTRNQKNKGKTRNNQRGQGGQHMKTRERKEQHA